jgi:hypothetical protein
MRSSRSTDIPKSKNGRMSPFVNSLIRVADGGATGGRGRLVGIAAMR